MPLSSGYVPVRERNVLLPGVSRLARLVARERDAATARLWETVSAALKQQQRLGRTLVALAPQRSEGTPTGSLTKAPRSAAVPPALS